MVLLALSMFAVAGALWTRAVADIIHRCCNRTHYIHWSDNDVYESGAPGENTSG